MQCQSPASPAVLLPEWYNLGTMGGANGHHIGICFFRFHKSLHNSIKYTTLLPILNQAAEKCTRYLIDAVGRLLVLVVACDSHRNQAVPGLQHLTTGCWDCLVPYYLVPPCLVSHCLPGSCDYSRAPITCAAVVNH